MDDRGDLSRRTAAAVVGVAPIAVALCLSVIGVLMFKVLPLVVGAAADYLHLGASDLGLLASSDLVGITIASVVGPWWVRRVDWRIAAWVALGLVAIGNAASALPLPLGALLAVRLVTGLGEGMASGLALVILSDTRHPDRSFALAVAAPILVGLGAFQLIPPLAQRFGYGGLVMALAALAVLFAMLVPLLPARGRPQALAGGNPGGQRALVMAALGAAFVYHVGLGAIWAFIERVGRGAGLSAELVGRTLGVAVMFGLAGSLLATLIGVRFGRLWPIAAAVTGQCVALTLLAEPIGAARFALAACAFQFLWLLSVPYQLGIIAAADQGGRIFVLALAFQAGGVAVGPVVAGFLLGGPGGFTPVRIFTACSLALSLVLYAPVTRRLARHT